MYNINRRKFLGLFGCGCCSLILPSCSTVPITERKQLSLIPESTINRQAATAYQQFKTKMQHIVSQTCDECKLPIWKSDDGFYMVKVKKMDA